MIFKKDAKNFYREVGKETIIKNETPTTEDVEKFWKQIGSGKKGFNEGPEWIKHTLEVNENKQQQDWKEINTEELEVDKSWKSPKMVI